MSKTYRKHPKYIKQPQLSASQAKRRKQWEAMELPNLEPRPLEIPAWKPMG